MRPWLVAISFVGFLLHGCATSSFGGYEAGKRAMRDFGCRPSQVVVEPREDLGPSVFDVSACGHRARYSCAQAPGAVRGTANCMREPDPPAAAVPPASTASTSSPAPSASAAPATPSD